MIYKPLYPYFFVCAMVDKYERLVMEARTLKEEEFRLNQWMYWMKQLISYEN